MTRKEAIEFGNMWLDMNQDAKDSDTYQFFVMALKALDQESILDKIRVEIEKKRTRAKQINSVLQMNAYIDCLQIIDKYKAESEG